MRAESRNDVVITSALTPKIVIGVHKIITTGKVFQMYIPFKIVSDRGRIGDEN